jgi:hypothetical protein
MIITTVVVAVVLVNLTVVVVYMYCEIFKMK